MVGGSDSPMLVTPLPAGEGSISSYPDQRKMRSSTTQEDKTELLLSEVKQWERQEVQPQVIASSESGQTEGGQWTSRVSFNMGVASPSGPLRRRPHKNAGKEENL